MRYEADGSGTLLADQIDGVSLNSPNDVVVHPDGGIWFTDPGYGAPQPISQKEAIYRIDTVSGAIERVDDVLLKANGLCFSGDYKGLYVADTGMGEGAKNELFVFEVNGWATPDKTCANSRS